MPTAYVNIGTNLGDRRSIIGRAVACIRGRWSGVRLSDVVESEPWGYESSNMFLNIGVAFECGENETPLSVHRELQEIQRSISSGAHRTASGGYADRYLDIDFIAMDAMVVDCAELQLPHPRMHMRDFVLRPMAQLAPGWKHPLLHVSCRELLSML